MWPAGDGGQKVRFATGCGRLQPPSRVTIGCCPPSWVPNEPTAWERLSNLVWVMPEAKLEALMQLEERLWWALNSGTGGSFYARELRNGGLVVMPWGVMTKDRLQETGSFPSDEWRSFRIDQPRLVTLTSDSVILVYQLTASAEDSQYLATMSSVYVYEEGGWSLAFHQETELTSAQVTEPDRPTLTRQLSG